MFRRVAIVALALLMVVSLGQGAWPRADAFGARLVNVSLFGVRVAGSVLFEGRAYVPAKALQGLLGLTVEFDAATQTLWFNSGLDTRKVTAPLAPYKGHAAVRVISMQEEQALTPPAIYHGGSVYVPLRLLERFGVEIGWDFWSNTAYAGTLDNRTLPRVGTTQQLERLLTSHMGGSTKNVFRSPVAAAMENASSADHSQTNIQVAGVDEADIAKTDGEYIYQVRGREVIVTRAYPVSAMQVMSTLNFNDETFSPQEVFVDENYLVVIGQADNREFHTKQSTSTEPEPGGKAVAGAPMTSMIMRRWWGNPTVKALVYDLTDRANLRLLREVEIEGHRLAARKIGSIVYLLSNRWADGVSLPHFRDSTQGKDFAPIAPSDIKYFPDLIVPQYLVVAAFDLSRNTQGTVVSAFLGAGNEVYMSHRNIYVAVGDWQGDTVFYRFAVNGVEVPYAERGSVRGTILNQFSMDEHNGYFRAATTIWADGKLSNAVFVLDAKMQTVGSITNIAPNERIYSARFMGDRGYMVTFVLVDPLFVFDLSDPRNPEILGELKIPGFSSYLHPLDENHLLGIGRDTTVATTRDSSGRIISEVAIELGIKLAIFDVTDVANPVEEHVEIIGGRGTFSEVLHNHKALLFDSRNNLMAFPVTIHTPVPKPEFNHGPLEFQGAIVYDVSVLRGFSQRARISHLTAPDSSHHPQLGRGGGPEIKRMLYVGEYFYALSDEFVTAHQGPDFREVNRLPFD